MERRIGNRSCRDHIDFGCVDHACISAYGYAGELAYEKVQSTNGGTGSFRMFLMDAMSNMDNETFLQGAKIEEV